jgi:thioredoxin-related protein
MQKIKWLLVICVVMVITQSWEPAEKEKIQWISFQELSSVYAKSPRPIIIDLYTDWCGWCKKMDQSTYKNEKLAKYINEHYYAVRYNAESTDSVFFNKLKYGYNAKLQTNDLAVYLTFGRLEYPTTVFLSSVSAKPAPLSGYMKPGEMEAPLKFFGEKADASQTFVEFNKTMKKEW